MKVETVFSPMIVAAEAGESLAEVASRLRFNDVGSAAVFEKGTLVGIITERDLARAMADRVDPDIVTAADYMTPEPASVSPDTDTGEAAEIMLDLGVRHLGVVAGGRLVGMISVRDVLRDVVWTG